MHTPWTMARAYFTRFKEEHEIRTTIRNMFADARSWQAHREFAQKERESFLKDTSPTEEEYATFYAQHGKEPSYTITGLTEFKFVKTDHSLLNRDGYDIFTDLDREQKDDNDLVKQLLRELFVMPEDDKPAYLGYNYTQSEISHLSALLSEQAVFAIKLWNHKETHFQRFNYVELEILKNLDEMRSEAVNAQAAIIGEMQNTRDAVDELIREGQKQAKRSKLRVVWRNPEMS